MPKSQCQMNVKVQEIKGVSAKGRKNLKPDAETSSA
jgi:hypothetical protein